MDALTILLIVAALVVVQAVGLAFIFGWLRKGAAKAPEDTGGLVLIQQRIDDLGKIIDDKLDKGADKLNATARDQFDRSQRLMSDITKQVSDQLLEVVKGVSATQESTKQVFTIAEQLQNLEKVLKHQKQRGNLGEASIEIILSNILPPGTYQMQYEFPGGETVDAIIVTKEGMIPIDAKFSLDNYQRLINAIDDAQRLELEKQFKNDLKLRIDETAKYVRPKDGTLPFAFMYIPAEAIYYDLLINEIGSVKVNTRNLIDYAYNDKKVIIVSPTTFAAYLQSVLYGFKAFKIEETAKDIAKNVEALGRHLKAYEDFYKKVGTSLGTTVNHYNAGAKELGKIDKDVLRITGVPIDLALDTLERPTLELDN